jgi:hypothetical protein
MIHMKPLIKLSPPFQFLYGEQAVLCTKDKLYQYTAGVKFTLHSYICKRVYYNSIQTVLALKICFINTLLVSKFTLHSYICKRVYYNIKLVVWSLWPCLYTPAGLQLELLSNFSPKLTLDLAPN